MTQGSVSNEWQEGWEAGVNYAKDNWHLGGGYVNIGGDCLHQGYLLYPDKWNINGFGSGFAEGVRSGLTQIEKQQK